MIQIEGIAKQAQQFDFESTQRCSDIVLHIERHDSRGIRLEYLRLSIVPVQEAQDEFIDVIAREQSVAI